MLKTNESKPAKKQSRRENSEPEAIPHGVFALMHGNPLRGNIQREIIGVLGIVCVRGGNK